MKRQLSLQLAPFQVLLQGLSKLLQQQQQQQASRTLEAVNSCSCQPAAGQAADLAAAQG
jgi:hypothetical protein